MTAYNVKAHPAFSRYDLAEAPGLAARMRRLFSRLGDWAQERRAYSRTFNELQALGDRDLADIGLVRGDIAFVARQAARGNTAARA